MTTLAFDLLGRIKWFAIPVAAALLTYTICSLLAVRNTWWWVGGVFLATLLVLLVVLVISWVRRRSQERGLESSLASGGAGRVDQRAEIEALRRRWKESLATLRKTGAGGGGGRALAALPWYVIIGAPASGKSTLLRKSGVDFPIGDAALRGLQGTRNCDWWFSNVGIFLDTAGRFMSDESAKEWGEFLGLVRRQRTTSPINGVIVTLAAADLFQGEDESEEEFLRRIDADARRIRTRLDELIDHLGINFPVWVVLTKVDLLGGFVEFFGRLDAQSRARMMGWTEAPSDRFDQARFAAQFDEMVARLVDIRPHVMATAPLRQRHRAFGFPDEVADLRDPLGRVLQRMFEPNVFQETPFFRGLFVTSGTQEGAPLQQAVSAIRERFGDTDSLMDATGVMQQAYFVEDLVRERIVGDRAMTWTTQTELDRGRLRRLGMNLVGCSLPVLALIAIAGMWRRAGEDLDRARERASRVGTLPPVDAASALCGVIDDLRTNKFAHLGLNAHWMVRRDAWNEEKYVCAEGVLRPLLEAARERVRRHVELADVDLAVARADYEAFLALVAFLERTAKGPAAAAPGNGDGGAAPTGAVAPPAAAPSGPAPVASAAHDADEGPPPGGCDAPGAAGADDERGLALAWSLLGMTADGLDPAAAAEARTRFGDRLRRAVVRVGFGPVRFRDSDAPGAAERVFDPAVEVRAAGEAFRAVLDRFVVSTGQRLAAYGSVRNQTEESLGRRLEALRRAAAAAERSLMDPASPRVALEAASSLARAAAEGEGGAEGGTPHLDALRAALAALESLRASPLLAEGEFATLVEARLDLKGLDAAATGKDAGEATAARVKALDDLARALGDLRGFADGFRSDPDIVRDAGELGDRIEEAIRPLQAKWEERVRALLAATDADARGKWEAMPADRRRGWLAIEQAHAAVARDVVYARFLDDGRTNSYGALIDAEVQKMKTRRPNPPEVGVESLRQFTLRVARLPETMARVVPPVAKDVRDVAVARAQTGIEAAIAATRAAWVEQFKRKVEDRRLPDSDAASDWIRRVFTAEQPLLAAYADQVSDALLRGPLWTDEAERSGAGDVLRAAGDAVSALQEDFRFFERGGEASAVRDRVRELAECVRVAVAASAGRGTSDALRGKREAITAGLGSAPDRTWAALPERVRARLPGEPEFQAFATRLREAIELQIGLLEGSLTRYMNERWRTARQSLPGDGGAASWGEDLPDDLHAALKEFESWFGERLLDPLGGVQVAEDARRWTESVRGYVRRRKDVSRDGLRVEFTLVAIPPGGGQMPKVRVEYRGGREPAQQAWAPNEPQSLAVTWRPSDRGQFTIALVAADGQASDPWGSWEGADSLPKALRAAERAPDGVLSWPNQFQKYTGQRVKFRVSGSGLSDLLRWGTPDDLPGAPPATFVRGPDPR